MDTNFTLSDIIVRTSNLVSDQRLPAVHRGTMFAYGRELLSLARDRNPDRDEKLMLKLFEFAEDLDNIAWDEEINQPILSRILLIHDISLDLANFYDEEDEV